jgi:hypothetical protein
MKHATGVEYLISTPSMERAILENSSNINEHKGHQTEALSLSHSYCKRHKVKIKYNFLAWDRETESETLITETYIC